MAVRAPVIGQITRNMVRHLTFLVTVCLNWNQQKDSVGLAGYSWKLLTSFLVNLPSSFVFCCNHSGAIAKGVSTFFELVKILSWWPHIIRAVRKNKGTNYLTWKTMKRSSST